MLGGLHISVRRRSRGIGRRWGRSLTRGCCAKRCCLGNRARPSPRLQQRELLFEFADARSELVALANSFITLGTELLKLRLALIEATMLPAQPNRPCRALRISQITRLF